MKFLWRGVLIACLLSGSIGWAITPAELVEQIKYQHKRVRTMEATMISRIVSPMIGKEMVQKAHYYKKGTDKIRIETQEPVQQTMIQNGDLTITVDKTGKRTSIPASTKQPGMTQDPEDYLNTFDLEVAEQGDTYVVTGKPKDARQSELIGSLKLVLDKGNLGVTWMAIYKKDGSEMMSSETEYELINGIPVVKTTQTNMNIEGQKMEVLVTYKKIRINHELDDALFE